MSFSIGTTSTGMGPRGAMEAFGEGGEAKLSAANGGGMATRGAGGRRPPMALGGKL